MGLMDSYRLNSIMGGQRKNPYQRIGFDNPGAPETPIGARGTSFQQPEIQIPTEDEDDSSRYYRMIQDIRAEKTPGMTAYKTALQNRPQEEEYKPNAWTRTASALSGFSAGLKDAGKGITTAMGLNREPYRRAMEEYEGELGGLEQQAGMEQDERESRMEAIRDASRMGLEHQKFLESNRHNQALEGTAQQNSQSTRMQAEAATSRAQTAAAALRQQGWKTEPQTDGSILAYNPLTNERKTIAGDSLGAGNLRNSRANTQISREQLQRGLNQDQVNNYYRDADLSIRSRTTDANANKPATPAAQTSARELALDRLMHHPKFAKFISTDDNPVGPDDFTPEQWSTFQETLKALEAEIMAGGGF